MVEGFIAIVALVALAVYTLWLVAIHSCDEEADL